jgi:prevent-host-death family protein
MAVVTIHTAKTTLSQLLARAEAGEEIILARGKHPVARLTPIQPAPNRRRFGALRGQVSLDPRFFDPLPEEEIGAWE